MKLNLDLTKIHSLFLVKLPNQEDATNVITHVNNYGKVKDRTLKLIRELQHPDFVVLDCLYQKPKDKGTTYTSECVDCLKKEVRAGFQSFASVDELEREIGIITPPTASLNEKTKECIVIVAEKKFLLNYFSEETLKKAEEKSFGWVLCQNQQQTA